MHDKVPKEGTSPNRGQSSALPTYPHPSAVPDACAAHSLSKALVFIDIPNLVELGLDSST